MEVFTVENLSFIYNGETNHTLKNIDFQVNKGDFVVIAGESGSGKSTLLRMLKKEIAPLGETAGQILFKGQSLQHITHKASTEQIGFIMQNPNDQILFEKVWQELAFPLESLGIVDALMKRRIGEIVNFFGIQHWYNKSTNELSGGQKQLLNVATSLLTNPTVLLLDEPTAQLDPIAASEFLKLLSKLNKELGLTIIIVEHNLDELLGLVDRCILLGDGEIIVNEHPKNLTNALKNIRETDSIYHLLPVFLKIYLGTTATGNLPLTVNEGIRFIDQFAIENKRVEPVEVLKERPTSFLQLENIWFRYEKKGEDILKNTTINIPANEITTFVGGNGAGKSTILKIIAAIIKPYKGNVLYKQTNYKKILKKGSLKGEIGYLPQNPHDLFLEDSVLKDYKKIAKRISMTDDDLLKKIDELNELIAIKHLLEKHPTSLSGGEIQLAAIGKILLMNPTILLLDEPTKGLDGSAKKQLTGLLKQLKENEKTVVIVTHDLEFAAEVSSYCSMVFDGQVLPLETPKQFFTESHFYTTITNRITKHIVQDVFLFKEIIKLINEKKAI